MRQNWHSRLSVLLLSELIIRKHQERFSGLFMSLAATFPARGWAIIFQLTRLSAPKQPNFCRSQSSKNEVARAQEGPDGSLDARVGSYTAESK